MNFFNNLRVSTDIDQMAPKKPLDQGLHCLPFSCSFSADHYIIDTFRESNLCLFSAWHVNCHKKKNLLHSVIKGNKQEVTKVSLLIGKNLLHSVRVFCHQRQ